MSPLDIARRPGDHVGPWRVVAELGRGGWGTVYSAEHSQSGRWAAVKILSPEVCEHPAAIKRFRREAQATSAIGHANVVEVIETGQLPDGSAYYAMELLAGESLAQTLKREGRLRGRASATSSCSCAGHSPPPTTRASPPRQQARELLPRHPRRRPRFHLPDLPAARPRRAASPRCTPVSHRLGGVTARRVFSYTQSQGRGATA